MFLVFVFLPLLLPDGRLPSKRWRPVAWAGAALYAYPLAFAFLPGPLLWDEALSDNPLGIGSLAPFGDAIVVAWLTTVGLVLLGVAAAFVVRWRRSRGVERQQMKRFLAAAAVLVGFGLLDLLLGAADVAYPLPTGWFGLAVLLMPVAIGTAVLRYRLYDIDRIISRTVSYALLTGVLAGTYLAAVLGLSRLLAPLGAGSELSVASATLAAAAVFAPARRRIQTAVDRRFNRDRYDADQVVAAFRKRLRAEVDLTQVGEELVIATTRTVQPLGVFLWLSAYGEELSRKAPFHRPS